MLSLVVVRGPEKGRAFALPEREPQLIGRSTEALALTDATVSRRHAELTPEAGAWIVRDLDSRHGTFVNGARIEGAVALHEGDRLRCGDTEFLVAREGAAPRVVSDDEIHAKVHAQSARVERTDDGGSGDEAALALALVSRAAEPTDANAFLADAAELLAARLGCDAIALEAADGQLEKFTAPTARGGGDAAHAPLALVRRSIESREILAGREDGLVASTVLVAPFPEPSPVRGAFVLRRGGTRPPSPRDVACAARAAEIAALALAARGHERAHGTRERLALIGETVASLSHSIKNILQGLRFGADAVDLALSRGEFSRAQEGWPVLQRNLDRIHALVLNMLAWAKERALEPEPADANALVREVAELLAPAAGRRRVGIALELDPALPEAAIDVPSVHQALMNLVLNAVEAAPERTGIVRISSRFEAARDEIAIAIADNGPGFPDAVRARLFEPFVSTKGQRGTGLGLAVAHKIAARHGGSVELAATGPAGTEIALRLPATHEGFDPSETRAPRGIDPSEFAWRFGS